MTPASVRRTGWLWAPLSALLVATGCHSGQTTPGTVELPEAEPVLLDCPGYTSPRLGERGLVGTRLRVQVGENGRPMAVTPIQGPSPVALEEAVQLARGCIFEPAKQGGEPVTAWIRLLFRFNEIVVG
ncbi:MAG: energy transducer TonB [Gemmatimonadota bacterium]